uniref:Prostaglandin E receptor 2 n=1 Tax=Anas platyrhynchos TaxID=8839 RepID=A0A8B9TQZ1_ANAPL
MNGTGREPCERGEALVAGARPLVSALMFSAGLLGNLLALGLLLRCRRPPRARPPSLFHVLVLALVVTDLLGTCSVSPLVLASYHRNLTLTALARGGHLCLYFGFSMSFFGLATMLILFAMALERCLALGRPYFYERFLSPRTGLVALPAIYTFSAAFCSLPLVGFGRYCAVLPRHLVLHPDVPGRRPARCGGGGDARHLLAALRHPAAAPHPLGAALQPQRHQQPGPHAPPGAEDPADGRAGAAPGGGGRRAVHVLHGRGDRPPPAPRHHDHHLRHLLPALHGLRLHEQVQQGPELRLGPPGAQVPLHQPHPRPLGLRHPAPARCCGSCARCCAASCPPPARTCTPRPPQRPNWRRGWTPAGSKSARKPCWLGCRAALEGVTEVLWPLKDVPAVGAAPGAAACLQGAARSRCGVPQGRKWDGTGAPGWHDLHQMGLPLPCDGCVPHSDMSCRG